MVQVEAELQRCGVEPAKHSDSLKIVQCQGQAGLDMAECNKACQAVGIPARLCHMISSSAVSIQSGKAAGKA